MTGPRTLLARLGRMAPTQPMTLAARNFLIDERIADWRRQVYEDAPGIRDAPDAASWKKAHGRYLERRVFLGNDLLTPISRWWAPDRDPEDVPDTFRDPCVGRWAAVDPTVELVRVEEFTEFRSIAHDNLQTVEQLQAELTAIQRGRDAGDGRRAWDAVLSKHRKWRDHRPVFAAFFTDVADLFGATPEKDKPHWPQLLCRRLGLNFAAPVARGKTTLLVLKYPARLVREVQGRGRPMLGPSVLDQPLRDEFLPSPLDADTGHPVDLDGDTLDPSFPREVVHPPVTWDHRHVYRLVEVSHASRAPLLLHEARWLRLAGLRQHYRRPDFGSELESEPE